MVLVDSNEDESTSSPSLDGHRIWTDRFQIPDDAGSSDPALEFQNFKIWLLSYQPGFADLSPEVQESRAPEYFNQFLSTGDLPPLPLEAPGFMIMQDKTQILRVIASPHKNVQTWLEYLEDRLLHSFLSDPISHPHEQSEHRLNELITGQYIDPQIKIYLSYMLTQRYNLLLGIFRLVYSLYINNLKNSLRKMHIALQSVEKILRVVQNILSKPRHIYMAIFSNQHLVDQLIQSLDPHIKLSRPAVIEKINLSIREASQVSTLLELIKDNLYQFLMFPHLCAPRSTSNRVETVLQYQPESTAPIAGLYTATHTYDEFAPGLRRVATLETRTLEGLIELYVRVFVPDISLMFYKSIKAAARYIMHPETIVKSTQTGQGNTRLQSKQPHRCSYVDVRYEETNGPQGRSFILTPIRRGE